LVVVGSVTGGLPALACDLLGGVLARRDLQFEVERLVVAGMSIRAFEPQ
jgi:hypothetical protein